METIESIIARVVRDEIRSLQFRQKRLLNVDETAEYLGVSDAAVYNLVSDRRLAPVKIDRRNRFDIADLERLIEESKRTGIALR